MEFCNHNWATISETICVRISVDRKIFIRFWPKPVKKRCVFKFIRMSVAENMRHGTVMGFPVSVVVAEIVMQNIEEQAQATYTRTIPLWLRYVDDTFTAVHKDGTDDFHKHLNRQKADIQFTSLTVDLSKGYYYQDSDETRN